MLIEKGYKYCAHARLSFSFRFPEIIELEEIQFAIRNIYIDRDMPSSTQAFIHSGSWDDETRSHEGKTTLIRMLFKALALYELVMT